MQNTEKNKQILEANNNKIEEMNHHFEHLHQVSRQHPEVSWETRLKRLDKLENLIMDNEEIIKDIIHQDFGQRCKAETLMLEIYPTLEEIRFAKKFGKEWMKTKKVNTNLWFLPASSYVKPQPLGVIGIIAPWNYPLLLSLSPVIGALVAGNRVMIKMSEHTPIFASWLAKTIPEYFSKNEAYVVTGETEVSQKFSQLPFDHLIFTGSTQVGKHIMRAAAENLTPVTLELGGKSPVIIDKDCDLENAVSRVWTGKLLNAGQTCIAPDYLLIDESLKTEFIIQSKNWINIHYPDIATNPDYSHLINQAQFERIVGYLDNAKASSATVHTMCNAEPNLESNFMPPYIVTGLPEDSDLLSHEIFAPVLPIISYNGIEEAINYVNSKDRPLAVYIFSRNDNTCNQVVNETVSGGACVNDTIYHHAQHELPFGGVGPSGMGHYHGKYGFDTFSHQKGYFKQAPVNAMGLLQPPYEKTFEKLMKFIIR